VWGVSVDGVELYYQNRIKYRRNPLLWFISLLSLLIPVIFYKFIFLSVRK
jgi:beta-lactamase regulating signal transducer with metallopeptidase domain